MIFGPKGKSQERANHLNPGEQGFADLADTGPGAKGLVYLWDRKKFGVGEANY